jgi:tetratricopeptide (TPR) repeat protein
MLLSPVTYKSLGRDKLYDEDYLEAINYFNLFIEDDPSDCEAYFLRGLAYTGLLKYERAKKDYNVAIKINPDYAECYYHLGVSFLCLDQRGDAIQNFEYAAALGYEQADYILNKYFR